MLSLRRPQIRPVASNDLPTVAELEELCFKDPYPPYFLAQLAHANQGTFLVSILDEKIVGYAVVDKWSDHNHLVSIAVHPQHRRIGLGGQLLESLEEMLDGRPLKLELRRSNDAALRFYLRSGFEQTGFIHSYYNDGEDAILMEKTLRKVSDQTIPSTTPPQ